MSRAVRVDHYGGVEVLEVRPADRAGGGRDVGAPVGGGGEFGGGDAVPLRTVTVALSLPVLPAASRTDAVSTWLPSATLFVFHGIVTGPVEAVCMVATVWPATLSV